MKTSTKVITALIALVVLAVGAVFVYAKVINKADPKLTTKDLDNALGTSSPTTSPASTTVAATVDSGTTATTDTATTAATTTASAGVDGAWMLVQDGTTVGYRIKESLAGVDTEANGRTNDATGTLTIAGTHAAAGEFTVQMASMKSDQGRRDEQFNTRIMTVDQFPTATFKLTSPIDFASVPGEGTSITTSATGDLTLRGVTKSVTFDVTAKLQNGKVGVLGNIPVTFADYSIPDPSNGFASVGADGLLEFVLVFIKT